LATPRSVTELQQHHQLIQTLHTILYKETQTGSEYITLTRGGHGRMASITRRYPSTARLARTPNGKFTIERKKGTSVERFLNVEPNVTSTCDGTSAFGCSPSRRNKPQVKSTSLMGSGNPTFRRNCFSLLPLF
jgi:hypothetical protein